MIYTKLLNKTCEVIGKTEHLVLFAFYGSIMYKDIKQVRDIDAFAVFKNEEIQTGRLDIYFNVNDVKKKASVYIVSEKDLYLDIIFGEFGGRWPVIVYHGAFYEPKFDDYFKRIYSDSMHSLFKHFDLKICLNSEEFFKENNIKICSKFPFYINSVLDFCNYPQLRKRNYILYEECMDMIINSSLQIIKNDKMTQKYLLTDLVFRNDRVANIRSFKDKLDISKCKLKNKKQTLLNFYGENSYAILNKSFESIGELIENIDVKNYELFRYYGDYKID